MTPEIETIEKPEDKTISLKETVANLLKQREEANVNVQALIKEKNEFPPRMIAADNVLYDITEELRRAQKELKEAEDVTEG